MKAEEFAALLQNEWVEDDPKVSISTLDVRDGNVVVVTRNTSAGTANLGEKMENLARRIRDLHPGVIVIAIPEGLAIEKLDAKQMARFGWVRA